MFLHYISCFVHLVTRGDVFGSVENTTAIVTPNVSSAAPTVQSSSAPQPTSTFGPTAHTDPDAAPCSGRPFDAFLQLKNGSIYAFRGDGFLHTFIYQNTFRLQDNCDISVLSKEKRYPFMLKLFLFLSFPVKINF